MFHSFYAYAILMGPLWKWRITILVLATTVGATNIRVPCQVAALLHNTHGGGGALLARAQFKEHFSFFSIHVRHSLNGQNEEVG